ncbi:MAG: NUDIX hydrolase [Peptococcaceae bacterium]
MAQTEAEFLHSYDASAYEKPSVTTDIVVFSIGKGKRETYRQLPKRHLQILLIRRKHHPFQNCWALPGGFVNLDESLREAAARELHEETGLEPDYLGQLYTWGEVERDPRMRVISTSYMAIVNETNKKLKAGDDASEACWFDLSSRIETVETHEVDGQLEYVWYIRLLLKNSQEELNALLRISRWFKGSTVAINREIVENNGLAFDHAKIIEHGLEKFRHKIKYTDLLFKLVPEFFTLTELQHVYEAVVDKKISRASFRRSIADKVTETEQYVTKGGHRPSQLYVFNPYWLEASLQEGVVDLWS